MHFSFSLISEAYLKVFVCSLMMNSRSAIGKLPSIYVFSYFPFGFEGRMWDLIVSVPDHCLSFYFSRNQCSPTERSHVKFVFKILR